jgi:septal ring factor EnvC (AmiA/AmiB activator)
VPFTSLSPPRADGLRLLGTLLACAFSVTVLAAPDLDATQSDLAGVKERLRALQREIADAESTQTATARSLEAAERAVSEASRALRDAAAARSEADREIAVLRRQMADVTTRIEGRQTDLAAWLRRHYMFDRNTGMAHILEGSDPNVVARNAYYLSRVGEANLALVNAMRADLASKRVLEADLAGRVKSLAALEAAQRAKADQLEQVRAERATLLASLGSALAGLRNEAAELKQDEARLGKLIDGLQRIAKARAAARAKAQAAASRSTESAGQPAGRSAVAAAPREPVVGQAQRVAGPTPTGVSFADLHGRLAAPVRGEVVGRFGAPRAGGGTSWKGVFFRTAASAEVHAIAAGEVVFSDWMRGFGNLIIVDHGDEYLSIYGNNDALFKVTGDRVTGGDVLAATGAGEGSQESGLYFEIRRRGQPVDPLEWIRLK